MIEGPGQRVSGAFLRLADYGFFDLRLRSVLFLQALTILSDYRFICDRRMSRRKRDKRPVFTWITKKHMVFLF
jgi:hypothetical protein